MIIAIYLVLAAAVVVGGAVIYVMAEYEQQQKRQHGIERICVHFRRGQCRLTRNNCSPCSLYKTEEERIKHK